MKQIKTIARNANAAEEFDAEVNKAIAEGWALVKRDVLRPYEGPTCLFFRMLYAELEREIVEKTMERECGSCRYCSTAVYDFPCTDCKDANKWEEPET